jgi:fructokinase
MGGGVMVGSQFLFPRVRTALRASLGGYIAIAEVEDVDTFVVPPALGNNAGPLGAIVLGELALG